MRVSLFASSSSGNCTLLSQGESHLLIDAGVSLRRLRAALSGHGLGPEDLCGVLITHEHTDHTAALPMLCRHCSVPLYAPRTVANHLRGSMPGIEGLLRDIAPFDPFSVGGFTVTAFPTPHDAEGSVGYRVEGEGSFGFCTDCGCVTEDMLDMLRGCDGAVIEANHDTDLLCDGPYPVYLKRRILSERGHLSNECCAALAVELARCGARTLILGHLSQENNRPALAREAVCGALVRAGFPAVQVEVGPVWGDLSLEIPPCR